MRVVMQSEFLPQLFPSVGVMIRKGSRLRLSTWILSSVIRLPKNWRAWKLVELVVRARSHDYCYRSN